MQCPLFRSLLEQSIESHADSVSVEVRTHGTTCTNPACAEAWNEFSLLSRVVPQWKALLPSADLTDRVLAELSLAESGAFTQTAHERPPAAQNFIQTSWHDFRSPQQRSWSIALSVAAVILLVGTVMLSVPQAPNAELVMHQRNNPALPIATNSWDTDSVPDVAVKSIEWVQKASTLMADAIVSIPEKGAELVPESPSWNADWPSKLEPLRRNAHKAWDNLLHKLPAAEPPAS